MKAITLKSIFYSLTSPFLKVLGTTCWPKTNLVQIVCFIIKLNNNIITMSFMFNIYDYIHTCMYKYKRFSLYF